MTHRAFLRVSAADLPEAAEVGSKNCHMLILGTSPVPRHLGPWKTGHGKLGSLDSSRENRRAEESNNLEASGGKQIDDLLNGVVGAVVGGFEFARWPVSGIWAVMEAAVGERPAQPFVEEEEEQRYLDPFGREAVGVAGAVAL